MRFLDRGYGIFLYRYRLTEERAERFANAGLKHVVIEVLWQPGPGGKQEPQIRVADLVNEMHAAREAGLQVHWFGWIRRDGAKPSSIRGIKAMAARLEMLIKAAGLPASFMANCEMTKSRDHDKDGVNDSWPASKPDFVPLAASLRALKFPEIGLTTHGSIGGAWPDEVFDYGVPQWYAGPPLSQQFEKTMRWAQTWDIPIWPALGCSKTSPALEMAGDIEAIRRMGCDSALWWSAADMTNEKLAVAVPASITPPCPSGETDGRVS